MKRASFGTAQAGRSALALELFSAAFGLGTTIGLLVTGGALALPAGLLIGDREAGELGQRQLAAGEGADRRQGVGLAMAGERDGEPAAPGPGGAADAVYVDGGTGGPRSRLITSGSAST